MSKLSFVIPAYNEEAYIGRCLEAIAEAIEGKDYDLEVIVVNNASTDKTEEVAGSYNGVIVVNEPNKGLVRARQAGFVATTGDLIANIDADTVLPAGWIDTVFKEFASDEKIVALSGPYTYYDLSPALNYTIKFYYWLGKIICGLTQFFFKKGAMVQGGNFVLKRSALEKIGGFNVAEFDFYGEDTDIALRMSKVGKVKFTFDLPMVTSGRRLAGEGVIRMSLKYGINYLWPILFGKPFSNSYKDIRPSSAKTRQFLKNYSEKWDKDLLNSTSMALVFLTFSLVINYLANLYAFYRSTNSVGDIILDNIPQVDTSLVVVYGAVAFTLLVAIFLFRHPKYLPFVVKSVGLFILIRAFFMSLTHIGPVPGGMLLPSSELLEKFSLGRDLFFSGHVGLPFLLALIFWPDRFLRYLFILISVIFGI
ncbi:MAG: glycosyltransferase family 2 protein, partial [Candidatus Vogelbacteria bacterium]|nr:glycosyltransferase family 2 protein [Candidatus Vogelbacteria bacterium]